LGNISHVVAFRSSSKSIRKLNLQLISNNEFFQIHTKLELGMLDVVGKLVIDIIHLWRWNFEKN
jgi:hypothetical protein